MSGFVDLPIDPKTNDLVYKDGKIVWVKGNDEIVQRVRTRLRRVFGEWFLYYTAGIPYFNGMMLGSNNPDYVRLVLRNEILETKGVTSCDEINIVTDSASKKTYVFARITVNAETYTINEEI